MLVIITLVMISQSIDVFWTSDDGALLEADLGAVARDLVHELLAVGLEERVPVDEVARVADPDELQEGGEERRT